MRQYSNYYVVPMCGIFENINWGKFHGILSKKIRLQNSKL